LAHTQSSKKSRFFPHFSVKTNYFKKISGFFGTKCSVDTYNKQGSSPTHTKKDKTVPQPAKIPENKYQIRKIRKKDLDSLVHIENLSYEAPWTLSDFTMTLDRKTISAFVIEHKIVCGFVIYGIEVERLYVWNIAVLPEFRRKNAGKMLISRLKDFGLCIAADVRESNLSGHLFFRDSGFVCTEILEKWYDNDESAYHFECKK